jgi:type IV pilus assembly protein PilW
VSEVQENGRFASAFLRRAARLAGNFGCDASKDISGSTLSDTEATRLQFFNGAPPQPAQPIGGTEGGGINSDELILRGSTGGGVRLENDHASGAANLIVETDSGLTDDSFAVISDCSTTHIFKITGVAGRTITHTGIAQDYTTSNGARVQEVQAVTYCIGQAQAWTAVNNLMALRRLINPGGGQTCPNNGEELVEGIQNLQVLYGVVTGSPPSIKYVTAPAAGSTDLANVKTLRVELLVRSLANNITSTAVPPTLAGAPIRLAANDRYLYKVMTNTISLRNKGT